MFKRLEFDVTFPSTGRHLAQKLDLHAGFWAITGPNESGKSFIFEMLRFALFGTVALRGVADDYKSLRMAAGFEIKGVSYSVTRTMKAAELKREGETVASGVTAVNQKIVEILGFGIAVFDMACSINQGEVERLGTLTPGQRKQMVDSVLGIDALEVVAKWAMDEARLIDKETETLRRRLIAPEKPEQPEGYLPTDKINLPELREQAQELAQIEGFLSVGRDKPTMPSCKVDLPAENLRSFAEKRKGRRELVAQQQAKVAALPETAPAVPDDIDQQWETFDAYAAAQRWLKANPVPDYSEGQLRSAEDDYLLLSDWSLFDAQQIEISRLKGQRDHVHTIDCPACQHEFPLDQEAATKLDAAITELEQTSVAPTRPRPAFPPISHREVAAGIQAWLAFDADTHATLSAVEPVTEPSVPRHLIATYRAQADQVVERRALLECLAMNVPELEAMPDYEQMLVEREAYEAALPVYREQLAAFEAWSVERAQKEGRAKALQGVRETLVTAEAAYALSAAYEAAMDRFGAAWQDYNDLAEEIAEKDAEAEQYRKVREVMTVLRSLVKQHLMPSLNKVASYLLHEMTGGQRQAIFVDEDFNVIVDRQRLDTLSGSGKACANLAIRIALGQVLTNRVFSCLMADEIDASMDEFRADQTSNVLCTLEKSISQVLQVSHKPIESNNSISLGASSEPSLFGAAA